MEYILAALAFVATVVGIVGKTWKSGRPTPLGWAASVVAFLVLVLSVGQQIHKEREEKKIAAVAYERALRSIHGLVEPFAIILADIDLRNKEPGTGPTELNGQLFRYANAREDQVGSKDLLEVYKLLPKLVTYEQTLDSYKVGDRTLVLGKTSPQWNELFERTAERSFQELDSTMGTYRSVMDSPAIAAIERLRNDFLVQRLNHIQEEQPEASLGHFLHLTDRLEGAPAPIFEDFLGAAESAQRLCRDRLDANR